MSYSNIAQFIDKYKPYQITDGVKYVDFRIPYDIYDIFMFDVDNYNFSITDIAHWDDGDIVYTVKFELI